MDANTLIAGSELPARIRNLCRDYPYLGKTFGDLATYKSYELRRWRHVGEGIVEETKVVLKKAGLEFTDN
ncbi:MAG: hypothetical protein NTV02_01220 [Candidatus Zambryskibacteria bacterium]|nr:hypothetical protein [Candidatus Zambryskibacteria bacterium]